MIELKQLNSADTQKILVYSKFIVHACIGNNHMTPFC